MAYTLNDAALPTVTGDFAGNDYFGLDGANGPRKVLCSRFVLNDKSYADPAWITSLAASKVGLGSVENKSSATIRGEITSGNVTTALGFTPYNASNPSGYITSSALSSYLPLSGGTLTGASTVSVSSWVKWTLETIGVTARARQGSDGNGLNFTSNALWTGSAWAEDDTTKKKFAYIQHLGNGRHEFRTSPTGTGISWTTSLTVDENSVNSTVALTQGGNQVLHAGNIKTINGNSVLGSGDITISASSVTNAAVITALGFTPYNSTNPSGYISSITSANVTTALGYTPYNATNPNGYISSITSANVTTALGYTPYNSSNPSGYITSSALSSYLPLSGGTLTGNLTIPRHVGVNSLVLNTYATVNPTSNVFLYSQPNDRDSWIYLDSADTGSNWGIYHRQIDTAVSGLPGNSIGFVGGGNSALKAYISLADGSANFAGALTQGGNQVLHAGNYTSYAPSLTGSGASGTWGISISGNASTAYGLNVHTARNNEANKVVRTDANGYIQAGWINTDSGDNGTTAISRVYASHDGYVRYYTPANFRTVLDVPTRTGGSASGSWGISVTGTSSNITAYTINQSLGTGNGPTFDQVYVNGWFRNVGEQGLYNGTHGHHFYATSNQYFNLAGNDGSVCGLILRTGGHQGSVRGYLYANSGNNVGFLTSDGNWQIRCNNSEVELYDTSYANDFRTYITYDRNDTAYYCDPNSTTRLSTLNVVGDITVGVGQNSSNIYMADNDEGQRRIHCNSNRIGFLNDGNGWGSYCGDGGEWYSDQSVRSPIFYDQNDTSYHCDPNGTSELSTLTAATRTRWDMPRRTFNRQAYTGGTGYWTGTRGWGGTFNWNQAWGYGFGGFDIWGGDTQHPQGNGYIHAQGICSGLHHVNDDGTSAYGFMLVGGNNASDRLWYRGAWGNTGNSWREIPMFDVNSGNGSWMWFAGWYDNNNSGYYVDPNGTSRMGTINADTLNSYGTIAAYYSDDRLKTRFNNIGGALDMVCSLNGFFYEANETAEKLGYKKKREVGLSAQEVQRILPEIISPAPIDEQYMTIQYDRVVPLLVEAIKELRLELNQLKSLVKI